MEQLDIDLPPYAMRAGARQSIYHDPKKVGRWGCGGMMLHVWWHDAARLVA